MKFSINLILFYTVTYYFGTIDSRSYRRDLYMPESTNIKDETKSKEAEMSSEDSLNVNSPYLSKRTLKQNFNKPIQIYSNPIVVTKRNYTHQIIHENLNTEEPNILSMDIGESVVKVSSSLHSKHIDIKSKDGGYEISVNPKFSHIIEILPKEEPSTVHKKELSQSEISKENFQGAEKAYTDRLDLDSHFNGLNGEETSFKHCTGTQCLLNVEDSNPQLPDSDGEKSNVFSNGDNLNVPTAGQSSEISEFTTQHPNLKAVSDSMISTETTEQSDNISQVSAFIDEFEGSGEEFSSEGVESDRNSLKDGRLLNIFSRGNNSSPTCTTPKGESGQCRRIQQCLLSDALNNFNVFLQQLCLIRGALVGICCPDNPVIEVTNSDENSTEKSVEKDDVKQPPEGCGLNTKTRIVGGTIAGPHEWTWMVALLRRNRFYCGGVIINNWYILTAAHCVLGMDVKDLTVRLGEYDFNEKSKHKEDISVAEIKRHAQFVTLTFQHDIALLKLQRSIQYSKFVGSICLPTQKARDYSDIQGTVVGWGTVSFGGAASPVLRQVTVPVWKNEDCDRTYFLENISDAFMCAGSPDKGEDACQGDSGGPLMTLNDGGRWEVIGIVSWGRRCGDPTYPGVYTRVTTYLDWILQNTS